jgi:plasmid maintenance system antidote protein VapI
LWLEGKVMRIDLKVAIIRSRRPQYEFAQAIGVSEYRLSRYVHGRAQLTPAQEAQLAALLHLGAEPQEA